MQLARFVQIFLLRDVFMYMFPGCIFGTLLSLSGFDQYISGYAKFIFGNFGQLLGTIFFLSIAYFIGYFLFINTTAMVHRVYKTRSHKPLALINNDSSEKNQDSPFSIITDDLFSKVSHFVGEKLIYDWSDSFREEVGFDARGVKYIRYLCEMQVMEKHPDIHHITIERRSALKNFQTAVSGAFIISGGINVINALTGIVIVNLPSKNAELIIGIIFILLGFSLFRSLGKMDKELRVSIWRAFHAMSLIEENLQSVAKQKDEENWDDNMELFE